MRPAQPELAYSPDDRAEQLDIAEVCNGKLAHRHVGKRDLPDFVPDEASAKIDALLDKLRAGETISFDDPKGLGGKTARKGVAIG